MKTFALEVSGGNGRTGWVVIQVTGTFDPNTACALRERAIGLGDDTSIVIDLSHAAPVHDASLEILVDTIRGHCGGRIVVRGLSAHQERVLQYLGITSSAFLGLGQTHHAA